MDESLNQESEKLRRAWMRHDPAMLRDYLVASVEDPRLNAQSILTRHFLVRAVCGGRFCELMDQELRFAAAMNWLVSLRKDLTEAADLAAVLHSLRRGADNAEGIVIPSFVGRTFAALPATADGLAVPNYVEAFLADPRAVSAESQAGGASMEVFQQLWRRALAGVPPPSPRPSLLEAACGSANDYRFFDAFGLTRMVDYAGFDLCDKNVENARAMFPAARFESGNVFDIAAVDKSFDYLLAHDLFEHLSMSGLEAAVQEVCRVTRRALCLGFFSMDEIPEHIVRPVEDYHWNTLSLDRLRQSFAGHGFSAQAVHIGTFLREAVGCDQTHNPHAYTLILRPATGNSDVP